MVTLFNHFETRGEFHKKLTWFMFSRVIIITFLLGATVLLQFRDSSAYLGPYLLSLYIIIISTYLLTLFCLFLLRRIKNLTTFTYLQIMLDLVYVTAIVYITGGIESIFSFLYILTIINASILLYRQGGLITASASSILYGACLDLEYCGLVPSITGNIPSVHYYQASDVFYTIAMNVVGFYATALLSSFLAEQLRKSKEELKEREIDYRQLQNLHDNIVQSIGSGILTLNQKGEITSFNKAAQDTTGYTMAEAIGKKFDYLFIESRTTSRNHGDTLTSVNPLPRFETSFARPDGNVIYLGFSTSILRDKSGNEIGKILTFRDLTSYREMEEKVKRMDRLAAVGQLAAGIAHEIRNPLTSLSGCIQVLRDELDLQSENRRLMEIALRETERLNALITDFLLFAHPEQGQRRATNLSAVANETITLFMTSHECRKNIDVTRSIAPDLYILGDDKQIKQVLWNVLKNAAQAQPDGGLIHIDIKKWLNIEHGSRNKPEHRVRVSIQDRGCGIPHDARQKIFDPFFTTKEFGSGLGLAITYRIMEQHSGEISIRSEENHGTKVILAFPLLNAPVKPLRPSPSQRRTGPYENTP